MSEPIINTVKKVALSAVTRAFFNRHHYTSKIPLLIGESTEHWRRARWSRDYLTAKLANTRPVVSCNDEGIFDYNQSSSTGIIKKKTVPFKDAMDMIYSDVGYRYYIQQQDLSKAFPQLESDIALPDLLDQWKVVGVTNLWISGQGCKTPLHFDASDNFLVQMMGKKHVILFPPSESRNLYPAVGDLLPHCSRINIFSPDMVAYPQYGDAEKCRFDVDLDAGEMLYIPEGWWHAVESKDVSASVNFWWRGVI